MPQVKCAYPVRNLPQSAAWARSWVRIALTSQGLESDALESATVIMSELVANAVRHTDSGQIGIVCELDDDGCLILGVIDDDERQPVMLGASEYDESGRGLALIDFLADEWGCEPRDGGKLVYARLKIAQVSAARNTPEPCVFA